jgi:hypothetical protein
MGIWRRAIRSTTALLLLLATGACNSGGGPTEPNPPPGEPELTATLESPNFSFHFTPGDAVDSDRQEAFHSWAVGQLGISPSRIDYYKYLDRTQMARFTGVSANGFADPATFSVHSVFPWHGHETVHLYTALIGRPSDFFNEGIAVAMSVDPLAGRFEPTYSGALSVHDWARSEGDRLPAIATLVTTAEFRQVAEGVGYQTAGSFVAFLLSEYGSDRLGAFFAAGRRDDSRGRIETSFEDAFGVSLEQAEEAWHRFLGIG